VAISRYRSSEVSDNKYYETFRFPDKKKLDDVPVLRVRVARFDRLDQLAAKYLGDGSYWWVIAMMNDLSWGFKFEEGQILRIPVSLDDILRLV
jgi:nucleoid-associated protein YgaU